MKLRNAYSEQEFEAEDVVKGRKRSPKVRLVFRALLALSNEVVSAAICCTPSPGVPEHHFISHASCPVTGRIDVVVIGRNFVRDGSKLHVLEPSSPGGVPAFQRVCLLRITYQCSSPALLFSARLRTSIPRSSVRQFHQPHTRRPTTAATPAV